MRYQEYTKKLKSDHGYFRDEVTKNIDAVVDALHEFYQLLPKDYVKNYLEHVKREHLENPQILWYMESELGAPLRQLQLIETLEQADYHVNNKRVLDIGCSNGSLLLACRKFGAKRLIGIDIDPHRLKNASQLLGEENVALFPVDIITQDLPAQYQEVDAIFSTDVLEHVVDVKQIFFKVSKYLSKSDTSNFAWLSQPGKYHFNNILAEPHYNVPGLILLPHDQAQNVWLQLKEHFHSQLDYELYEWFTFWEYKEIARSYGLIVEPFVDLHAVDELKIERTIYKEQLGVFDLEISKRIQALSIAKRFQDVLYEAVRSYYNEYLNDHESASDSFESKLYLYMKYYVQPLNMLVKHENLVHDFGNKYTSF